MLLWLPVIFFFLLVNSAHPSWHPFDWDLASQPVDQTRTKVDICVKTVLDLFYVIWSQSFTFVIFTAVTIWNSHCWVKLCPKPMFFLFKKEIDNIYDYKYIKGVTCRLKPTDQPAVQSICIVGWADHLWLSAQCLLLYVQLSWFSSLSALSRVDTSSSLKNKSSVKPTVHNLFSTKQQNGSINHELVKIVQHIRDISKSKVRAEWMNVGDILFIKQLLDNKLVMSTIRLIITKCDVWSCVHCSWMATT